MALIEIPFNSYVYRFRRLTWEEEMALPLDAATEQHRVVLSAALKDVSGLPVTFDQGMQIMKQLPLAVVWLSYRADLPADRYDTTGELFQVPEQKGYRTKTHDEGDERNAIGDAASPPLPGAPRGVGDADGSSPIHTRKEFMQSRLHARCRSSRSTESRSVRVIRVIRYGSCIATKLCVQTTLDRHCERLLDTVVREDSPQT